MWIALPCQASSLQGHHSVNWGVLVGSDWGTGSGWQQSRQNFSTTCSDRTLGLNVMQKPLLSWSCTTSPYLLFCLLHPCSCPSPLLWHGGQNSAPEQRFSGKKTSSSGATKEGSNKAMSYWLVCILFILGHVQTHSLKSIFAAKLGGHLSTSLTRLRLALL